MEYFPGEDLLTYFENKKFILPEKRVSEIINKLAAAIFYLQSYGIIHRDLKLDNILMTDKTDKADIRLLDFGLNRIVGPNELCNEPYGSLVNSFLTFSILYPQKLYKINLMTNL